MFLVKKTNGTLLKSTIFIIYIYFNYISVLYLLACYIYIFLANIKITFWHSVKQGSVPWSYSPNISHKVFKLPNLESVIYQRKSQDHNLEKEHYIG